MSRLQPRLVVLRKDAIDAGQLRYFTGEQCKHGHVSERWTMSGACIECQEALRRDMRRRLDEARERIAGEKS